MLILDDNQQLLGWLQQELEATGVTALPACSVAEARALAANHAINGHEVYAEVRGARQPMRVATLPFTPHRYVRG